MTNDRIKQIFGNPRKDRTRRLTGYLKRVYAPVVTKTESREGKRYQRRSLNLMGVGRRGETLRRHERETGNK